MGLSRYTSSTFVLGAAGLLAGAIGCAESSDTAVGTTAQSLVACPTVTTNINQSMVVTAATHPGLTTRFTFARVMQQIFDTGGAIAPQTKLSLYQTWMATHGSPACSAPGVDPNGYGLQCPRNQENLLAGVDPYNAAGTAPFTAVALFNRFDLTPQTGETCGEHRIVFAVPPSGPNLDRAFIIFEAALPNPRPDLGIDGCLAVTRFWQSLSGQTTAARLDLLEAFYFKGITEPVTGEVIGPVVTAQNYGLAVRGRIIGPIILPPEVPGPMPLPEEARVASQDLSIGGRALSEQAMGDGTVLRYGGTSRFGQIRTNMFVNSAEWNLREFKMLSDCSGTTRGCKLSMEFVPVASNPANELFLDAHANAATWHTDFVDQIASIAGATNANLIGLSSTDDQNEFESVSQRTDMMFSLAGRTSPAFRTQIQTKLTSLGSTLTQNNILDRATTQTCAGCHRLSAGTNLGGGITWPSDAGFVHVTEAGGLSVALTGTFLPFRRTVMDKFIAERCGSIIIGPITPIDQERTISGRPVGASN